jgi:hypothetical protein
MVMAAAVAQTSYLFPKKKQEEATVTMTSTNRLLAQL